MREESQSLRDHDVFEWVDVPLMRKPYHRKDGKPVPQKSRVVAQGFHELDTGPDTSAPVSHMEYVRLVIAKAAQDNLRLHQLDVKMAFLRARMAPEDPEVYVVPPEGLECSERQKHQIWRLKAWLIGLRSSLRG